MKRIQYILPALLTIGFLFAGSSCKKILELESKNVPSSNKFWKTDKDALAGLLGGYSLLRDALTDENRYYVYGDVPANTFEITYNSDYSIHQIRDGSFDGVYYGYLENLQDWTKFYKAIAQANLLIEKIPGIPDAAFERNVKNQYLGESYFLRAYNYFFISRVWGDVPLVLEAVEDVSEAKNYGREKQDVVLKQALADLDQAVAMLPQAPLSISDRGLRATKASALALKAHIHAWMKDYVKCEEATRDLVTNPGSYGLTFITDSASYAKMSIGKSTEAIFEININYDQNEASWNGVGEKTLWTPFLATRIIDKNKDGVPWRVHQGTMSNLFWEAGDKRSSHWFYYDSQADIYMLTKYSNVIYKNSAETKDPRYSNNILIFRLSDIILLRAEALYKTGKEGDARTLLNITRNRAGIGDVDPALTGVDFFYELIWERGRELYAEGHFYWDLMRTDIATEYFNPVFKEAMHPGSSTYGRNYWPIPRKLFKDNLLMKQTAYWNGRL
ncbi:RagB/SusD family nutrient uptake outer membrane protein [Chitinophaga sp. YIM B06452]|uniref:RagB/SusD family nutrient uptake outer membrane protein n=1 Tax=Chitinophaga sp. YIM B06452 TaxID=3082158 RepID=UPI0031FF0F8F